MPTIKSSGFVTRVSLRLGAEAIKRVGKLDGARLVPPAGNVTASVLLVFSKLSWEVTPGTISFNFQILDSQDGTLLNNPQRHWEVEDENDVCRRLVPNTASSSQSAQTLDMKEAVFGALVKKFGFIAPPPPPNQAPQAP